MKVIIVAAAAAFAVAAPVAATAKDNPGKGHGAHSSATPPGLAKKPHGMPPGQAKKMWGQGERLPPTYLSSQYYVAEPSRYSLPPAPYGQRWVRVGDQYYLAQTQTGLISQVISALLR
ncbi:RcnB family protein [Phenylobacterium sp.]|jgi:Ni/Co efflux regulator RcnB|uniref:RcnB family protein n=1 Tax=Phenylobacterium sp. TaxID=1871053 RepID=UPI002F93D879